MRVVLASAVLLLSGLLLSGCVGNDNGAATTDATPRQQPDWAVRAIFLGADPADTDGLPDHDHEDASIHRGLGTPNFQVLGHDPLDSSYLGAPAGTQFCGEVGAPGERQLAVVTSFGTDVALTVVDVTDRAAPKALGELVLPFAFTYDAAIFEDGRYAVIAANPDLALDRSPAQAARLAASGLPVAADGLPAPGTPVPFTATWRDACGEHQVESNVDYVPYGYSTILVDLSDPASPVVADASQYAGGRNVHSISAATVDGTRFVATSGLGALPCTIPNVSGNPVQNPLPCEPSIPRFGNLLSHFDFHTIEETPAGPRLLPYAIHIPVEQVTVDANLPVLSNGHTDASIEQHPVTGETIAYLADWDGGFRVIRLDGPGRTTALAAWGQAPDGGPDQMRGNIHSARPVAGLRDGRHYVLTGQEVAGNPAERPTGQIVMMDMTDPATITPVARWTLPVDFTWPASLGLMFSTHYPILVGDTMFVAMYHTGVWAVDASPDKWPDLPSLGVFMPDAQAETPHAPGPAPEVLEVLDLGDGDILVFDANTGAYTVRFDPSVLVPPALPLKTDVYIG